LARARGSAGGKRFASTLGRGVQFAPLWVLANRQKKPVWATRGRRSPFSFAPPHTAVPHRPGGFFPSLRGLRAADRATDKETLVTLPRKDPDASYPSTRAPVVRFVGQERCAKSDPFARRFFRISPLLPRAKHKRRPCGRPLQKSPCAMFAQSLPFCSPMEAPLPTLRPPAAPKRQSQAKRGPSRRWRCRTPNRSCPYRYLRPPSARELDRCPDLVFAQIR